MKMKMKMAREASAVRNGEARTFTHKLRKHFEITHQLGIKDPTTLNVVNKRGMSSVAELVALEK